MGAEDMERQALNVFRMQMLGAEVVGVDSGSRTLKDAINEAFRDWVTNVETTHYVIGSVVGPHPFPWLVKELQRVIGEEARAQILERAGTMPDVVCACVGGGSNAMGIFSGFVGIDGVRSRGRRAGGTRHRVGRARRVGVGRHGRRAARRAHAHPPGAGRPHHARRTRSPRDSTTRARGPSTRTSPREGLATYVSVTDDVALEGFHAFSELEGIVPALEAAHVIGWLLHDEGVRGQRVLLMLSGRGDKDAETVRKLLRDA